MHGSLGRFTIAGLLAALAVAAPYASPSDKDPKAKDDKRPKLTLKAQPVISIAPSKVAFTAELIGGANDYEEFYCPTVEWDWGDGTQSEASADCDPYEAGKSDIRRRYSTDHVFRSGAFQVVFRLKRHGKVVASATAAIQVQPGLNEPPPG